MRNIFISLMFAAVIAFASACGNKDNGPEVSKEFVAEWHLIEMSGADAKSLPEVYIDFKQDLKFELYQKIGEGRFRRYGGTYALTGSVLSGKYSDGKDWGSSYAVSFDGSNLVLKAQNGSEEVCTYEKKSLSQSDKDQAEVVTKAAAEDMPRYL